MEFLNLLLLKTPQNKNDINNKVEKEIDNKKND